MHNVLDCPPKQSFRGRLATSRRTYHVADRVRVRLGHWYSGFRNGDTGTVLGALPYCVSGVPLYYVQIDGERGAFHAMLYGDELEMAP